MSRGMATTRNGPPLGKPVTEHAPPLHVGAIDASGNKVAQLGSSVHAFTGAVGSAGIVMTTHASAAARATAALDATVARLNRRLLPPPIRRRRRRCSSRRAGKT